MKQLLLLLFLIPNILMADGNPFADGYHQDTNPFADGYVQDKGIFEDNLK